MKNGCKRKVIYYCNALRFNKNCCSFYVDPNHSSYNCEYKDGDRCTNPEAQKHADGFGQKYPKPTEPCWQWYEFPDRTRGMMEILSNPTGELFAFDLDHYPFGRSVEVLNDTWGPRSEWKPDE